MMPPTVRNDCRPSLESAIRHETGHALAAASLGYRIHFLIYGRWTDEFPYGWVGYDGPAPGDRALIWSAGVIAQFLHRFGANASKKEFIRWVDSRDVEALAGINDWINILGKKAHLDVLLTEAALPYFDQTVSLLMPLLHEVEELTGLLRAHPPGFGPYAFDKARKGERISSCDRVLDTVPLLIAHVRNAKARPKHSDLVMRMLASILTKKDALVRSP
jgi:hypothetical protein